VHGGSEGEDEAISLNRRMRFPFYYPTLGTGEYTAPVRLYQVNRQQAYRMVVPLNTLKGEYYGIQGMTWRDPPILDGSDEVRTVNGRRLQLYHDGDRLRLVAWKTRRAVYWVSNTLSQSLSKNQMLAIAGSLRRLPQ